MDEEGIGSIKATDLKLALERIGFVPMERELYKLISEVNKFKFSLILIMKDLLNLMIFWVCIKNTKNLCVMMMTKYFLAFI